MTWGKWQKKYGSKPRGFKNFWCLIGMHTYHAGHLYNVGKWQCSQCGGGSLEKIGEPRSGGKWNIEKLKAEIKW